MAIRMKLWASVVLLGVVFSSFNARSISAAGSWYVTRTGNDASDCLTPTTPCATINAVLAKPAFQPRDIIFLEKGSYFHDGTGDTFVLLDQDVTLSGGWDSAFQEQVRFSSLEGNGVTGLMVPKGVSAVLIEMQASGGPTKIPLFMRLFVQTHLPTHPQRLMALRAITQAPQHPPLPTSDYGGITNDGTLTMIDSGGGGLGGYGILNNGTLTMQAGSGAGGFEGPGIINHGALTVRDSLVTSACMSGCTGIVNDGTLTMDNSLTWLNGHSGLANYGIADVTASTIAFNGGGVANIGTLSLTNVTISVNTAGGVGGGVFNAGTLFLNSVTIAKNFAPEGGAGLFNDPAGTVQMQNSIIANNLRDADDLTTVADCAGSVQSDGYNLLGNATDCDITVGPGDLLNQNPLLYWRPLPESPSGDEQLYHPLLFTSPAIDAGNPAGCTDHAGNPLSTDQRGVARLGRCDIGAYEYDPAHDPLSYQILPLVTR